MARPLFEQYKDALRRGHLAVVANQLDAALEAYHEAASLVPERPLPHTSMATVLHALGRRDESLAAIEAALRLAPDDDATLRARDAILSEPVRATPRRQQARLEREAEPERAAKHERAAERAAEPEPEPSVEPESEVELLAEPKPSAEPEPEVEPELDENADRPLVILEPEATTPISATGWRQEPDLREPGVEWPAIDLPSLPPPPFVGPPPDPLVLQAQADGLMDEGNPGGARDMLLTAVAVYEERGQFDAALDACLQLLAIAPGDPRVHLAIAGLQLDHGWRQIATEKIDLLIRLTSLSGDTQAEADVRLLAADRLQDAPA